MTSIISVKSLSAAQRFFLTTLSAAGLVAASVMSAGAADFYKGKKITVIVGYAPGGGIDTTARLLLRHFKNHIDGSPDIIVQNMPGAASVVARNYLSQRAPKDGTVIAFDAWNPLLQIVKMPQVLYDYRKLTLVGALRGGPFMMFARKDIVPGGLKQPADIAKAQNLVYAGQQPGLTLDMHGRISLNLLGVKYNYVSGYKGARAIRLAIARNEANITTHGLQGYRSGVEPTMGKNGVIVPMWYFPYRNENGDYVDSPLVPDFPKFQDIYKQVRGANYESVEWKALELMADLFATGPNQIWGPPGMDKQALPPLQKAFAATFQDPAFQAEEMKVFKFKYDRVEPKVIEAIMARFDTIDPQVVAYFRKLLVSSK